MLGQLETGHILSILFWIVVSIAALIVGYVVVMRLKSWLSGPDISTAPMGFSLSDLRKLHDTGQMSDEEFEKAKVRIIEASKKTMERPIKTNVKQALPPNFPDVKP